MSGHPFLTAICAVAFTLLGNATQVEKPPIIYVSWPDELVVGRGDGKLDTPEKIARMMKFWRDELGADTVLWRIDAEWLMKYADFADENFYHLNLWRRITSEFDPAATAIAEAHRNGMKILAYRTIFDQGIPPTSTYGGAPYPWQSRFFKAHPEYLVANRDGTRHQEGVVDLIHPAARRQLLDEMKSRRAAEAVEKTRRQPASGTGKLFRLAGYPPPSPVETGGV